MNIWLRMLAWLMCCAACVEQKRSAETVEDPDKIAIDQLTLKIKTYPDSAALYEKRSSLYFQTGRIEKALDDISRAISLKPDEAEYYFLRGFYRYADAGDDSAALTDFQQAERMGSQNPEVYLHIGNIFTLQERYDRAIAYYRRAESLDSLASHYPFVRAFALYRAKRYDEALEACSLSLRLDSSNVAAANLHFELWFDGLKNDEKALDANRIIFKIDSLHPLGFFNLGLWYFRRYERTRSTDDLNKADRYYSRAVALDPGFAAALYNRAYVRFVRKDYAPALSDFERCVQLDSADARAHFHIGLIYEKYDEREKARAAFRKALRHAPEFRDARDALARLESSLSGKATVN
ncbi:MAG: tetratricopeptide repeat protein [Bacteroidia bacterium]|nr:tetratricopeptide repeat protein [Bacteroidia bacterium]